MPNNHCNHAIFRNRFSDEIQRIARVLVTSIVHIKQTDKPALSCFYSIFQLLVSVNNSQFFFIYRDSRYFTDNNIPSVQEAECFQQK